MKRISLVFLFLAACSTAKLDSVPGSSTTAKIESLPDHLNSGITVRDRMIVTDPTAWSKVWATVVSRVSPAPPLPAVDFDRETIVVAAMGQRSSGGYVITIDSAVASGDTIVLSITERSPGLTCGATAALTAPVALARVLRPRAVIRFVERTAVTDCG